MSDTSEHEKPIPLDDFCRDLSLTDKRIEMIAGFHASEIRAKQRLDHKAAYHERYIQFTGAKPK